MPNSDCPVCRTADIVCGKWTLLVIRDLADGRSRFCELERSLEGISPRTLSLRLRALEEEGIVARQTFPEVPPRVEYALTEKGRALVPIIESMRDLRHGVARRRRHLQRDPRGPAGRRRGLTSALHSVRRPAGEDRRPRRTGAHAQPRAARLARRLRRGSRPAARRRGVRRGRGPVRADGDGPARAGRLALYCYRPLTGSFIGERIGVLARLPSYPAAVQGLATLPDLPAYLQSRGRRTPGPDRRSQADAALQAFLTAVWTEATEFTFDPARFAQAYAELETAAYDGCTLSVVLAPVDGLMIESEELPLGEGLALVRAGTLKDAPGDIGHDEMATVALLALEGAPGDHRALEDAGRRLRRLQTALRLWDDAEPALGPTAWARTDGSAWWAVPLATGFRRPKDDCLLAAEEEDALRAFCSLVSRRTPRAGELAWALRRFELGCERASAVEALTDWLLAARALLADPDQPGYAGVAERMAAICAPPEDRPARSRASATRSRSSAPPWPGSCGPSRTSRS